MDWAGYRLAVLVTFVATLVGALMAPYVAITNVVMVYVLAVVLVAVRSSVGPAALASVLGVAAFDFFFVPPAGTFEVADIGYLFTFGVILLVNLMISALTTRLREQSTKAAETAVKVQVEEARADLLSAVSHDLRTPLASIEGSASALLAQSELSDQSRQLAATVQEESKRMSILVRNLLDMTRVQGAIALDRDWYSADELIANAILRTESLFHSPVNLLVDQPAPLVRVDGVLMEQVLVNLLENAARHAGSEALVTISVRDTTDGVSIEVTDDGPGLPAGFEERVFERFYAGRKGGSGLGLAICRAAVEAHGGTISALPAPSGGTTFRITLPSEEES